MYRRDLLTAEIERLAQVLARIMGLKVELKLEEAATLFNDTMANSFGLPTAVLAHPDPADFKKWLTNCDLPPEKLDSLSEFLFYELGISEERNRLIAAKLNLVYQCLSEQHKIVHLVNFHRQEIIQQYL